jgi:hypothetical protein
LGSEGSIEQVGGESVALFDGPSVVLVDRASLVRAPQPTAGVATRARLNSTTRRTLRRRDAGAIVSALEHIACLANGTAELYGVP